MCGSQDEVVSRAASPAKGAKGAPPPAKKDAKGKGGAGDDGPPVPEGQKLVADPDFAPTHFIEVSHPTDTGHSTHMIQDTHDT